MKSKVPQKCSRKAWDQNPANQLTAVAKGGRFPTISLLVLAPKDTARRRLHDDSPHDDDSTTVNIDGARRRISQVGDLRTTTPLFPQFSPVVTLIRGHSAPSGWPGSIGPFFFLKCSPQMRLLNGESRRSNARAPRAQRRRLLWQSGDDEAYGAFLCARGAGFREFQD